MHVGLLIAFVRIASVQSKLKGKGESCNLSTWLSPQLSNDNIISQTHNTPSGAPLPREETFIEFLPGFSLLPVSCVLYNELIPV